ELARREDWPRPERSPAALYIMDQAQAPILDTEAGGSLSERADVINGSERPDDESTMRGRSAVLAQRGLVATDHPLASAAGLRVLQDGGNAIDAAVCIAGTLGVVMPMMTGIGGDTFIVYYQAASRRVMALNGSGGAPRGATAEFFGARGYRT